MTALIKATVKYQAREVETKHGKRINAVFIAETGEEIRQWADPSNEELKSLKKNQKITLIKDGNKYTIVSGNTENKNPDVSKNLQGWDESTKKALFQDVKQLVEFYAFCTKQVKEKVTDFKEEESIRAVATTVFIQAIRKV